MRYAEVAARGVAWLDEYDPGWALRIDLTKLRMNAPCGCVIGQLYVDYWEFMDYMTFPGFDGSEEFSANHGLCLPLDVEFNTDIRLIQVEWDALRDAWEPLILARQVPL